MHLRADDGIRTRDPHLGKVMRYQLRYIRAPRTRSSSGAKHDDSPRERAHTNFLVRTVSRLSLGLETRCGRYSRGLARASLRRRSPLGAGPVAQWESVRFTRGRSLVRSQPGPQHQCSQWLQIHHSTQPIVGSSHSFITAYAAIPRIGHHALRCVLRRQSSVPPQLG